MQKGYWSGAAVGLLALLIGLLGIYDGEMVVRGFETVPWAPYAITVTAIIWLGYLWFIRDK